MTKTLLLVGLLLLLGGIGFITWKIRELRYQATGLSELHEQLTQNKASIEDQAEFGISDKERDKRIKAYDKISEEYYDRGISTFSWHKVSQAFERNLGIGFAVSAVGVVLVCIARRRWKASLL